VANLPSFSGKFELLDPAGAGRATGPCSVAWDAEEFVLTPAEGVPLLFDLGDVDRLAERDYELSLALYGGSQLRLHQFGKAFQNLTAEFLAAYRDRLVRCLLLGDLREVARFDGAVRVSGAGGSAPEPAEIRLYQTNLAVLPRTAAGFQWRLSDIATLRFDDSAYGWVIDSDRGRLTVSRLAKRTTEFGDCLRELMATLSRLGAQSVAALFPFLDPDRLQKVNTLMREGRAVAVAELEAIDSRTRGALVGKAVDNALRPYFEVLAGQTATSGWYTGFKLTREEADLNSPPDSGSLVAPEAGTVEGEPADRDRDKETEPLYWFFFPLSSDKDARHADTLAWEASSRSGRATYFFRIGAGGDGESGARPRRDTSPEVAPAVHELSRALITLNFRREPVYLPDDALASEKRFRHYAIAVRRMPELAHLRRAFLGRAIHSSLPAWQKQVDGILQGGS
jgi:hypothetical protein